MTAQKRIFQPLYKDIKAEIQVLVKQEGRYCFLVRRRRMQAVRFAKNMGFNVESSICLSKEQDTLTGIMDAFKGKQMNNQFNVADYRIDLYFPPQKLAV